MDQQDTRPESTEVVALTQRLTPAQVKADADLIMQVMQACMKMGMDYGIIPGCGDKPTLFKPGAEKLMLTFRLASKPIIHDLSTSDEIRYRVVTEIVHAPSSTVVGYGVGEASSHEDKYKWRKMVCQEEWDEAPEDRRRKKWNKTKSQETYQVSQVRTNPADIANTVLKMADKRSIVSGILKATAASSIFTQDLEDMPKEMAEAVAHAEEGTMPPPPIADPRPAQASQAPATMPPGAQESPTSAPGSPVPSSFIPMASKVDKGSCGACADKIGLGEPIYFDKLGRKAYHRHHYA